MARRCECEGVALLDDQCTRTAEMICPSCEMLLCVGCRKSCHQCDGEGNDEGCEDVGAHVPPDRMLEPVGGYAVLIVGYHAGKPHSL